MSEQSQTKKTTRQDPRGPLRRAVRIDGDWPDQTILFDCGHASRMNPTMQYSLDDPHRCFKCTLSCGLEFLSGSVAFTCGRESGHDGPHMLREPESPA